MRNHNVFRVLQLNHDTVIVAGESTSEPHPILVDDWEEWVVEPIAASKLRYRKEHYLIPTAGYRHIRTS